MLPRAAPVPSAVVLAGLGFGTLAGFDLELDRSGTTVKFARFRAMVMDAGISISVCTV